MSPPPQNRSAEGRASGDAPILITGGAGFIGTNLAHRLASAGHDVAIFDNLSRAGVQRNLAWLRATHGDRIAIAIADIRDADAVRKAVHGAHQVFHLAAQVAVTTSLADPVADFDINARGTLNLLEAMRTATRPPRLVFTSTNKVYGALTDVAFERGARRYMPKPGEGPANGIDERRPLDFHSPYGCSKGTADQYVLDYARSYGLPAIVFRMSCIYGPHQCGTEDQGWVAHFLLRSLAGEPITIFGDGRQVRDILHVDDLVDAFLLAQRHMDGLAGEAFNIGGGAANSVSLLELVEDIAALNGRPPVLFHGAPRVGDQVYYVSDHGKFTAATGWRPRIAASRGVALLHRWLSEPAGAPQTSRKPAARLAQASATP